MRILPNFEAAIKRARLELVQHSSKIHTQNWQGMDISKRPEGAMHEILNWTFQVPLNGIEDLDHWQNDIRANLPWADYHFLERVGSQPLNPGVQWANWPWGNSADKFRTQVGPGGENQFDHTYQERFWPQWANQTPNGRLPDGSTIGIPDMPPPNQGIRFRYADLNDLVNTLHEDPKTRQAYLPIWFPEDGSPEAKRKPCTLGYWFIQRNGYLHMHYPIRSCDILRHFQDDCYLAVRLLLWILDELRKKNRTMWGTVKPGMYSMWIGSLHCFVNDLPKIQNG